MAENEPFRNRFIDLQLRARALFANCSESAPGVRSLPVPLLPGKEYKLSLTEVGEPLDSTGVIFLALKCKYPTHDITFSLDLDNQEIVESCRVFVDEQGYKLKSPDIAFERKSLSEENLSTFEGVIKTLEYHKLQLN